MTTLILNIGLNVGTSVPAGQLVHSLSFLCQLLHPVALRTELQTSASELTLIVELITHRQDALCLVETLAIALSQDAIAGKLDGVGFLVGPEALSWGGKFNPQYFLNPSWS